MSLSERIQSDLVAAMKARESERVGVLRLIKTALKNKEIESKGALTEEAENQLLQTLVKQRAEAKEAFEQGGRPELAEKEAREALIVKAYLPEEIASEQIESVISAVISELGATSSRDMGSVMKESMARLKATGKTVDGKAVNALVRKHLAQE